MDLIEWLTSSYISLGGTAANVLTVLSQLGFETKLLTAEYSGEIEDWYKHALQIRHIFPVYFQKSKKNLSVVIENVDPINNVHFFRTSCLRCKNNLINVILPSDEKTRKLMPEINDCNLLFYDRFSSGINYLANINKEGWNMYEPNGFRMYSNLLSGCQLSDIIKFSAARISEGICEQLLCDLRDSRAKIVIVTMGQKGLKFTVKYHDDWGDWNYLPSINSNNVLDTAGAGDWLTAGFLYELLSKYPEVQNISQVKLIQMLKKAQVLATEACGFIGAQGILKEPKGIEQLRLITGVNFWPIHDNNIEVKIKCPICGFEEG